MQELSAVCLRFNMHPARVFRDAFHYYEIRWSAKRMKALFKSCAEKKPNGNYAVVKLFGFVSDYCLDVLSGRATPLMEVRKIEGHSPSSQMQVKRWRRQPPKHRKGKSEAT